MRRSRTGAEDRRRRRRAFRYVAEGLLFHMPGRRRRRLDVERGGRTERLSTDIVAGMSRRPRRVVALTVLAVAFAACPAAAEISFEKGEIHRVLQHGPWPPPRPRDPSNGVSGDPVAIALGQRLLFDRQLSAEGAVACASCQPQHVTFGQFKTPSRRSVALTAPSMHDSHHETLTVPGTTASPGSPPRFARCESLPG